MNSHDLQHEKLCYEPPDQPDDNWYVKNKNAAQTEGYSYQVKLSMLLLLNGKEQVTKGQISRFYLATDMKEAAGFANIVFKCEETRGSKIIFLQTKHKEKDTQITKDVLLSGNIFNLNSYFRNYTTIRKCFSGKEKHNIIFGENYFDVDCSFIIFTNIIPEFGDETDISRITVHQDDILNFGEIDYYYKLRSSDEIDASLLNKNDLSQKKTLGEFLDSLRLFLSQPNEHELGEIIKQKVQSIFSVDKNFVEIVFAGAQNKMQEWFGSKGNSYFLTNDNRFFEDAARVSIRFDVKEPVKLFTGRNKELKNLHKILQNAGEAVISQMATVTGLGGVGKTELARKYISQHCKEYDDNVIWINAENYVTATESFIRVAEEKLGINTLDENGKRRETQMVVQEIYDYFARMHRKSLFVFDNSGRHKALSDTDEGIDKFLPSGPDKPYVIITSRDQKWGNIKILPLDIFSEEEAAEFIKKALTDVVVVEENDVNRLAEELQYLPLALTQAVAYITMENIELSRSDKSRFTISDYLELFEANAKDLLRNQRSNNVDDPYPGTVMTTWQTTIAKIKQKKLQGEAAVTVLNIISYLATDKIPVDFIFKEVINDEQLRHSAVELLDKYCMVSLRGGKVNVHRLVQQVTRIELEERGENKIIVPTTLEVLAQTFPYGKNKLPDISKKKVLLPHLEVFFTHIQRLLSQKSKDAPKQQRHILFALITYMTDGYFYLGNAQRQKELLEAALPTLEDHYGPNHLYVAVTLVNLGNAHGSLGDYRRKKELLERALKINEDHYGPNHSEVAATLVNLGNAHGSLGDPYNQKELLERALKIEEDHYGPNHFEVATTLHSLGNAHGSLGDPYKQKELLERALKVQEDHYGPNHFQVAMVLANLGNAHGSLGDYHRKKELLERALKIQEDHYGPNYFEVAVTLVNLGNAHCSLGDHHRKKELLERALKILEYHYGPNHSEVAATLVNLGNAHGSTGDPNKQKKLLERALKIQEDHYGPNHSEVAGTLHSLGNAHGSLGDHHRKKELLERALKIEEDHYGPNHFQVAVVLVNLSNAHGYLGDPYKQKELLERALKIQEDHYGPNHFQVAVVLVNLGIAHRIVGDYKKNEELLRKALPILKSHFGPDHSMVGNVLNFLSRSPVSFAGDNVNNSLIGELIHKEEHTLADAMQHLLVCLEEALRSDNEDAIKHVLDNFASLWAPEQRKVQMSKTCVGSEDFLMNRNDENEIALDWAYVVYWLMQWRSVVI